MFADFIHMLGGVVVFLFAWTCIAVAVAIGYCIHRAEQATDDLEAEKRRHDERAQVVEYRDAA